MNKNSDSSENIIEESSTIVENSIPDNKVKNSHGVKAAAKSMQKKFDSLSEWKKGHQSSYKAAESHNWIKSCSEHMSDTSLPLTKKQKSLKAYHKHSFYQPFNTTASQSRLRGSFA